MSVTSWIHCRKTQRNGVADNASSRALMFCGFCRLVDLPCSRHMLRIERFVIRHYFSVVLHGWQASHILSALPCPIFQMEESELSQAKLSAAENARVVIDLQAELARLETDSNRDKYRLQEEVRRSCHSMTYFFAAGYINKVHQDLLAVLCIHIDDLTWICRAILSENNSQNLKQG